MRLRARKRTRRRRSDLHTIDLILRSRDPCAASQGWPRVSRHCGILRDAVKSPRLRMRLVAADSNFQRATANTLRDLAARFARVLLSALALRNQRAQGRPGARCTRGPVCNCTRSAHTSIQVQRRASGLPCAMALRLIRDLPGEPSSVATVASAELLLRTWRQLRAPEPHDFAVRSSYARQKRSIRVHRILLRVRDDRERPSVGTGREGYRVIWANRESRNISENQKNMHLTAFC